ncbi:hypothetical protein [Streptomyces sp. NPDC002990]
MSDFDGSNRTDQQPSAVARTAQEKAGESAALVGDKAGQVAGTAKQEMSHVAGEATAQARNLAGQVREQLQNQAQSQTQRLADNVRRLADELKEMSEGGAKPDSTAAGVARQIADSGHQVAARLEHRGPDGLVTDLQNFARRRPGMFLAGAALAGFAVARAGKGVSAAGSASSDGGGAAARQGTPSADGREPFPNPQLDPDVGAGYADPLDTYGQSQPPHVTPAYGATGPGAGAATPPPPAYPPPTYPPTGTDPSAGRPGQGS